MKNVLVVGGNGFLGKNLVPMLNIDYKVTSIGKSTGLNLLNIDETLLMFTKINPDVIINLAAHVGGIEYVMRNPSTIIDENSRMYLNLYKAASERCPNAKIINALSNCSYPSKINFYTEKEWWNGMLHPSVMSFGTPKLLLWMLGECYHIQNGMKSISVILPNAYGINDGTIIERTHAMNAIIMRMIQAKRNNDTTFTIWGTGTPIREWIYMPDAARIIMGCIEKEFDVTFFNAGQKQGISILDTTKLIAKAMNYDVEFIYDTGKPDGTPIKIMDDELFRTCFPNFQFTPYETGIKNTIEYYEKVL